MHVHAARAKSWLFSILFAFVLFAPGWVAADDDDRRRFHRPIDRIVVFGTSLSDPGNGFFLNGNLTQPPLWPGMDPLTLVPASEWPYAAGDGRFSNGPTWVEQLARPIGLSSSVKAAYDPKNRGASNFAVGGATARGGTGETTLSDQLGRFFSARPRTSADTLFVIEIGGNDVRDGLLVAQAAGGGPAGVQAAVQQVFVPALTSVGDAIFLLWRDAGAKNFLVWNVPNLGRAPAIARTDAFLQQVDPTYVRGSVITGATTLTAIYNNGIPGSPFTGLAGVLNGLSSSLPGIHIVAFDAFGTIEKIATPPLRFGLQNVTDTCISLTPPFQCSNPNRYLFWDGIHPTRAGHGIVAIEVGKALIADLLAH